MRRPRAAQVARTKERLLETAAAFFELHPRSALSLPALARLAGVTPPTVYANFGTIQTLMDELYAWVLPRLGTREALPPPERLHEVPLARFPRFAEHAGLLRSTWTSGSWSERRKETRTSYIEHALANLREGIPALSERDALIALGPVMAFSYPPMWQWLRDVLGLNQEDAELAAVWATRSLVTALKTAPPKASKRTAPVIGDTKRPRKRAAKKGTKIR